MPPRQLATETHSSVRGHGRGAGSGMEPGGKAAVEYGVEADMATPNRRSDRVAAATPLAVLVLFLVAAPPATCEDLFFSASAYAPGAGGSEYVHEVEVHNPSGSAATFELAWLPTGQGNSNPTTVDITVDPGRSTRLGNVLLDAFGLDPVSIGALRLRPGDGGLVFDSRILNVNGGETIGQVILATPASVGFVQGEDAVILGLREDADFRSNIWCVNATDAPVLVNAELMSLGGLQLEVIPISIPPLSNVQRNRIFQNYAPTGGYVRLSTPTPGGRAICDGAVVGNLSNDPATEPGTNVMRADTEFCVPYAVESATRFSTVDLFAPNGDVLVTIELLPSGTDNTNPDSAGFMVADGQVVRLDHILANVFSYQGTAALRLSTSGGVLLASSRTVDSPPAGPVSLWVPAQPTGQQFVPNDVVTLIHLRESADFQTDVGFVNTSPTEVDLAVTLYGETGEALGSIPVQLLPFGHAQIDGAFSAVGHPVVPVGFAAVTTSTQGASYLAYATVTDLNTRDAYHVKGQRNLVVMFEDGFESGDTSAWSSTVP